MRLFALLLLPLAASASLAQPAGPLVYPPTARGDVVEEQFGERVADPYRWLENDVRAGPAGARLGDRAERSSPDAFLAALPGRAAIRARMTQLYNYERFGVPGEGRQPLFLHPQ